MSDAADGLLDELALRVGAISPTWAGALAAAPGSAVRSGGWSLAPGVDRGIEAIYEGWRLHRGTSRIADGIDNDLALLVGDWCYAAGLCDVAAHGTLDDVAALARLIADVSHAAAAPRDELEPRWDAALDSA